MGHPGIIRKDWFRGIVAALHSMVNRQTGGEASQTRRIRYSRWMATRQISSFCG